MRNQNLKTNKLLATIRREKKFLHQSDGKHIWISKCPGCTLTFKGLPWTASANLPTKVAGWDIWAGFDLQIQGVFISTWCLVTTYSFAHSWEEVTGQSLDVFISKLSVGHKSASLQARGALLRGHLELLAAKSCLVGGECKGAKPFFSVKSKLGYWQAAWFNPFLWLSSILI